MGVANTDGWCLMYISFSFITDVIEIVIVFGFFFLFAFLILVKTLYFFLVFSSVCAFALAPFHAVFVFHQSYFPKSISFCLNHWVFLDFYGYILSQCFDKAIFSILNILVYFQENTTLLINQYLSNCIKWWHFVYALKFIIPG